MRFEGFCTYPHGWGVTISLLGATLGATACTWYAFGFCRFVVVQYESSRGNFDTLFFPDNGGGSGIIVPYKTAAGLFTWLLPNTDSSYYDDGTCRGYTRIQQNAFSDHIFEAIRAMSTISVMFSCFLIMWVLFMMSMSFQKMYIRLLAILYFIQCASVALSFLVFLSGLCNSNTVGTTDAPPKCSLDEGGLVAIAATILWFLATMITTLLVRPVQDFLIQVDGEIKSTFQQRQENRQHQKQQRRQRKRPPTDGSNGYYDHRGDFIPGEPYSQTQPIAGVVDAEKKKKKKNTRTRTTRNGVVVVGESDHDDAVPTTRTTRTSSPRGTTPNTEYADADSDGGMEVMYHI